MSEDWLQFGDCYDGRLTSDLRQGLPGIPELREAYKKRNQKTKRDAIPGIGSSEVTDRVNPPDAQETSSAPSPTSPSEATSSAPEPGKSSAGLRTLASFINLEQLRKIEVSEIENIWRLRHAPNEQSLCATIPLSSFKAIEATARTHPYFILPLPKPETGNEVHFLQWTFPAPDTVVVLFTHLAEFKLRGEYSQPHTVVTHHLELAEDKQVVLLQGEVTGGRGVSVDEAKWLLMCLQKFYGPAGTASPERRRLLEQFARGDETFSVEKLVEEAEKAI